MSGVAIVVVLILLAVFLISIGVLIYVIRKENANSAKHNPPANNNPPSNNPPNNPPPNNIPPPINLGYPPGQPFGIQISYRPGFNIN